MAIRANRGASTEVIAAFRAAQQADPAFALAYWAEQHGDVARAAPGRRLSLTGLAAATR